MSEEEIFSNSPKPSGLGTSSVCATPLQSYLREQQSLRHQRIAEDRKARLLEAQSELDVANCQNEYLDKENVKLRQDIERLKHQLEDAKNKLFSMPEEPSDELVEIKAHNRRLRYSIAEQKDTEKYHKDIETRLEVALKENQTYESRLSALQATLKERSAEKSELALQVDELRESLRSVETQNVVLQENVEELHKEVEQLKNFAAPLRSKKSFGGFSTPNVGGYSVGDISVDDPQFSPLKDGGGGEIIGNNLILDLREEIEQISEELKREKEQRVLEVEKSEFLESRLATLESENATQQSEIEALSQSKVSEIEKLRCQMSSELQRTQERLEMLTEKNEFLMSKISNLELDKESREVELKNLETSCRQNERDIEKLSSEITSEMERCNLQVAENETLSQKLSEAEKEIEQQKHCISELSRNFDADAEKCAKLMVHEKELLSEIASEKESYSLQVAENETLNKKLSEAEKEIEQQKRCISELSRNFDADAEKCAKLMVHEKELLSEIASEKERYSLQVAENETLNKKLSEAVKEIEQQTQSIAKLSQNCVADAEKYAESLAGEKEVCNSEVEKNWALTEKVSTLQNQILAQEMTLKEQSELMQAQVVQFEQVTEKLTSELKLAKETTNSETKEREEKLMAKISILENQNRTQNSEISRLTEMLHSKAGEFNQLTTDYEKEVALMGSNLKQNFEHEFQTRLELACKDLNSRISTLETENGSFKAKNAELFTSLTDIVNEVAEYRKQLEQLNESAKSELLQQGEKAREIEKSLRERLAKVEEEKEALLCARTNDRDVDIMTLQAIEDLEKKIREMEESHEKALCARDQSYETKWSNKKLTHQKELYARDQSCEKKLENMKESHEKELCARDQSCEKKLENMKESHRKELCARDDSYETKLQEMKQIHGKSIANLDAELDLKKKEICKLQKDFDALTQKFNDHCADCENQRSQLANESKKSTEEALTDQKTRYEAKVKAIAEKVNVQYKSKLEEALAVWNKKVDAKTEQLKEFKAQLALSDSEVSNLKEEVMNVSGKYSLAKQKIIEISDQWESMKKERDLLTGKYAAAKKAIVQMQEQKRTLENQLGALKLINEQMRREMSQSKGEPQARIQIQSFKSAEEFKMPKTMPHTPGRGKPGRTQSEASIPRRPPSGVGPYFQTEDEASETFTSSHLNDLKAGHCPAITTTVRRISELARRNSLVPPHLKSSYPAETQLYDQKEFTDDDLRQSRISLASTSSRRSSVTPHDVTFDINERRQSRVSVRKESFPIQQDTRRQSSRRQSSSSDVIMNQPLRSDVITKQPSSTEITRRQSSIDDSLKRQNSSSDVTKRQSSSSNVMQRQSSMNDLKRKQLLSEVSPRSSKRLKQEGSLAKSPIVTRPSTRSTPDASFNLSKSNIESPSADPFVGSTPPRSKKPSFAKTPSSSLRKLLSRAMINKKPNRESGTPELQSSPNKKRLFSRLRK